MEGYNMKKEVDITFPAVHISIGDKVFEQASTNIITKDISKSISDQISTLQKLLNDALEMYTVNVEGI